MASIKRISPTKFHVRWRDPHPPPNARKVTVRSLQAAREVLRQIQFAEDTGQYWNPRSDSPPPVFVGEDAQGEPIGLVVDYLAAHEGRLGERTLDHYERDLLKFARFLRTRKPRGPLTLDLLSRDTLEQWWSELLETYAVSTARLHVTAVKGAWSWGHGSQTYADHIPHPSFPKLPSPTFAEAVAPTWEQMDAVIHAAAQRRDAALISKCPNRRAAHMWEWRRQLLWILRSTGLRVSQAMRLQWERHIDLDLQELYLHGDLGKSAREARGRTIPLAPVLCEEMATWGVRAGWVIAPNRKTRLSPSPDIASLWQDARVPERVWAPPEGRTKGNTHHGFRKGFKTALVGWGVRLSTCDYLVGHHRGLDHHYLDVRQAAREAVSLVPRLTSMGRVIPFRGDRRP